VGRSALQAGGMRAITADQRGHGNSDWAAADDYEIGHFAADVAALGQGLPASPPRP
jgi:pimeloyl-ACP methyl ester carboxylesterase